MTLALDSRSLAVLFVRVALALYLGAAGLALLTGNTGTEPVWLPLETFSPVAPALGIFLIAAALLLLIGWAASAVAVAIAAVLIVVLVAWLMVNPLHNTMNHLMPFMAAALVTLAFTRDRRGLDETTRVSLVLLFARLFLGSIFVAQGTRSVMKRGLADFARRVYVEPLAGSWIPEPLLWGAGVTNPIIQIATGILLILGLRTRFAAIVMAAFLISIFFGHLLKDPFDRGQSPHAYAMANFLIAIVVLWLHPRGDRFSIDAVLARRQTTRALSAVAAAALLVMASFVASPAHGEVVSTPHVKAELLLEKPSIAPGESFDVALRLRMKDGWHTYWKHPGDSGEPTELSWKLPPGFTAGAIQWPYPQKISLAPLTTYGYEGEVMLLVPFKAASDAKPGTTARVTADAYWMVCEKVCIPEEVTLALDIPIGAGPVAPTGPAAPAFASTRAKLPIATKGWNIAASEQDKQFVLRIDPPQGVALDGDVQFFAGSGPLIEYSAPQTTSVDAGGVVTMRLVRSPYLTGTPAKINGILLADGVRGGAPAAFEFDVPFSATAGAAPPVIAATAKAAVPPTLLFALALAFAGGVILNLMPCVFPVVSLKVLSFVQSAGDDPRRVRAHGLTFASGVLVAFWALAALLLALRAAGEEIGWGFQLQSPGFVAAMAFLLFGLGLSLAGLVEIGTPLTRIGGPVRSGHRASFMNGVLATVVATPCTAPFMGAALGFAMTQSAFTSMLIFTALGAGMAAPYVALSAWPPLLRFLPRPGAWMLRFRQLTAFPLFATVAWLAWVFGHQTGIDGVLRLLLGLTLLALGLWIWGQWVTLSAAERTKWVARTAGAGFIAAGLVLAATSAPTATAAPSSKPADGIAWEVYSEERVAEHRAAGRPVFIDFTAAWCLTCKVNERIAFSSDEVHKLVKARNIAMLKADWTNKDAAISRALAGFGRSGVPLYVLYDGDPAAQPRLLPEILSPRILLNAFSEVK